MSFALHWELRDYLGELRDGGRLNLLIALTLHANVRMRCYPGTELLLKETGLASATLTKAKQWLIEHGALVLVPHDKRMDDECDLPPAKQVYQLTGVIRIGDAIRQYLLMPPEAFESISKVVRDILANFSPSDKSATDKSPSETKGISIPKAIPPSNNGAGSPPPKIPDPAKTPKPRKRDLVTDAVTIHFFETALGTNPETERLAAIIGNWLKGKSTGTRNMKLEKLKTPLAPDDVPCVVAYFKSRNPDASTPHDLRKIAKWTYEWINAGKPTAPSANGHDPFAGREEIKVTTS